MTNIDNQSALDACILGLECDPNHLYLLYVFFFVRHRIRRYLQAYLQYLLHGAIKAKPYFISFLL